MACGCGCLGSAHCVFLLCRAVAFGDSRYQWRVDWKPDRIRALQALFLEHYGFTAGVRLLVRLLQAEERM